MVHATTRLYQGSALLMHQIEANIIVDIIYDYNFSVFINLSDLLKNFNAKTLEHSRNFCRKKT
jgi:hypothetical protein